MLVGQLRFLHACEFTVSSLESFSLSCRQTLKDIHFHSLLTPSLLRVTIKVSKTGPFHCGTSIHIGQGRLVILVILVRVCYSTAGDVSCCPVGWPSPSLSLLIWTTFVPPSAHFMGEILTTAGIPGNFPSHSFRIAAATVAAWQSIPNHLIQALGPWTSNA